MLPLYGSYGGCGLLFPKRPRLCSAQEREFRQRQGDGLAAKTSCLLKIDAISDLRNPENNPGGGKSGSFEASKKGGAMLRASFLLAICLFTATYEVTAGYRRCRSFRLAAVGGR